MRGKKRKYKKKRKRKVKRVTQRETARRHVPGGGTRLTVRHSVSFSLEHTKGLSTYSIKPAAHNRQTPGELPVFDFERCEGVGEEGW